jgi:hypothetical protein
MFNKYIKIKHHYLTLKNDKKQNMIGGDNGDNDYEYDEYDNDDAETKIMDFRDQTNYSVEYSDNDYHYMYQDIQYANSSIIPLTPAVEIERSKQFKIIRQQFGNVLKKYKIKPKKSSVQDNADRILIRYIIRNLSQKPLILAKDGLFHYYDENNVIATDIESVFENVSTDTARAIEKELAINNLFEQAIINLMKVTETSTSYNKIDGEPIIFKTVVSELTIPVSTYQRLYNRWNQYKDSNPHSLVFDDAIMILLQRYYTLDSGGQQWGMPFVIRERFKQIGFNFECFASSLNHYLDHYCGMFYDIEKYFMSRGPFQNITYIRGRYMANPPYELNLLNEMVETFVTSLNETNEELVFMYGLPDWTRYGESFQFIDQSNNSQYYRYHIRFEPYKYPWHDFLDYNKVYKIPQSFRYVLSNIDADNSLVLITEIKQIISVWRDL